MSPHKILIVEDDKFINSLLAMKFRAKGYELISATNGADALELAVNEKPDIIILDILLPGMSGFEILEKIKANPVLKDIPVIIFSNLDQQSDMDRLYKLGASQFFVKANTTPDEITKAIEKALQSKGSQTHSQP